MIDVLPLQIFRAARKRFHRHTNSFSCLWQLGDKFFRKIPYYTAAERQTRKGNIILLNPDAENGKGCRLRVFGHSLSERRQSCCYVGIDGLAYGIRLAHVSI